jgi:hypothetical protein
MKWLRLLLGIGTFLAGIASSALGNHLDRLMVHFGF